MDTHVFMTLLKSVVFSDVVQVLSSDDNSSLHFHLKNNTSQDATTDANVSSERTFLVNVGSLDSLEKKDNALIFSLFSN